MGRFTDLYGTAFKKYADFSGRACRAEACVFLLTNGIIQTLAGILGYIIFVFGAAMENSAAAIIGAILLIFTVIFSLATMVPSWALICRRLHDENYSGWWQMLQLVGIIPFIGIFLSMIYSVLAIVFIYCLPGTEGENNYGPVSEKY